MKGVVGAFLMVAALGLGVEMATDCTQSQAKSVADVSVKIADDVCQVVAGDPALPDWVTLACAVEGVAGGVVKVVMPRAQWAAIHARGTADAGPGK